MKMRLFMIAFTLTLVACGEDVSTTTTTSPSETTTTTKAPVTTQPQDAPEESATVKAARADLAARLGVEESAIVTVSAEAVTWSDGSLGCPQPGGFYTQALVEGNRVLLQHGQRYYDYHAGAEREPFLCESDEPDGGYDSTPPLTGVASTG